VGDINGISAEFERQKLSYSKSGMDQEKAAQKCVQEVSDFKINLLKHAALGDFTPLIKDFNQGAAKTLEEKIRRNASARGLLVTVYPNTNIEHASYKRHTFVEFQLSYLCIYGALLRNDLLVFLGGFIKHDGTLQQSEQGKSIIQNER